MKTIFTDPELKIIRFEAKDVLADSIETTENGLPVMPGDPGWEQNP